MSVIRSLRRDNVEPLPKPKTTRSCKRVLCTPTNPCFACRGRAAQRTAARKLGVKPRFASRLSDEERWGGPWRTEVKAGKQVGPLATAYLNAEDQSNGHQAIGDVRPFRCVAMPDGWGTEGLVIVRLSTWRQHIAPRLED
jgi:hypothetical protein